MNNVAWWCSSAPGQVWTWRYTPFVGVWVVAGALLGGWLWAHRRAGRAVEAHHLRLWAAGVVALIIVSEWPIGQIGAGYLASVGILRWVVYTFVAAPLLLAGIPGWMIERLLPWGTRRQRAVSLLTRWPVALLVFNAVMFSTHLPAIVDSVKVYQLGSFTMDVLWLVAALIWWWPAIRREEARGAIHEPLRAFYLFASSVLMFVPAAFLTFSPLPLYGVYELAPPLWQGFDPVADQQAAGIMMNVVGGFVLWAVIAVLFMRWAREQEARDAEARRERSRRLLAGVDEQGSAPTA